MKITAHSLAGVSTNEDAVSWLLSESEDAAMLCVVDGASSLGGPQTSGWHSDAEWFAQSIATEMVQAAGGSFNPSSLLAESLRRSRVTPEAQEILRGGASAPTAGVAIVTVTGDLLCAATLGDPTIAVLKVDRGEEVVQDPALTRLDDAVSAELVATARSRGTHPEMVKPEFRPLLRQNRALANQPGGYWVADLAGSGLKHMLLRTYRRQDVHAVVVATDGFAMVVGANGKYADWRSVYDDCEQHGVRTVLDEARGLILTDKDWMRFPRFSNCDDMTLAVLALE